MGVLEPAAEGGLGHAGVAGGLGQGAGDDQGGERGLLEEGEFGDFDYRVRRPCSEGLGGVDGGRVGRGVWGLALEVLLLGHAASLGLWELGWWRTFVLIY